MICFKWSVVVTEGGACQTLKVPNLPLPQAPQHNKAGPQPFKYWAEIIFGRFCSILEGIIFDLGIIFGLN